MDYILIPTAKLYTHHVPPIIRTQHGIITHGLKGLVITRT